MAQQVEVTTAVHRALDRLQPADLALHRPGASRQRQGRAHRRQITLQVDGESRHGRAVGRQQPLVQLSGPLFANHRPEGPSQRDGLRQLRGTGKQGGDEGLFGRVDLGRVGDHQPCRPSPRWCPP